MSPVAKGASRRPLKPASTAFSIYLMHDHDSELTDLCHPPAVILHACKHDVHREHGAYPGIRPRPQIVVDTEWVGQLLIQEEDGLSSLDDERHQQSKLQRPTPRNRAGSDDKQELKLTALCPRTSEHLRRHRHGALFDELNGKTL